VTERHLQIERCLLLLALPGGCLGFTLSFNRLFGFDAWRA
jgi:hypothetical protein